MMKENRFIWADLSSYYPDKIKKFYENVFGWKYYQYEEYYSAYKNDKEVVGLYETPSKFQEMNMPSFWMSYIQVDNVLETVEKAKSLGGIIELVDANNSFGGVALIRDTLGAGFTVYDGDKLNSRTDDQENTLIFNELHVSDVHKSIDFYQQLFNWSFVKQSNQVYDVLSNNTKIATFYQIDNSVKSKYEYWVCTFGVKNLEDSVSKIKENNGLVVFNEGNRVLCSDGSEAFFYIQKI